MIVNFDLLYKNGHTETFVQDSPEAVITGIVNAFYTSFLEGKDAVVRFVDGDQTTMIRVSDISKATYTIISHD